MRALKFIVSVAALTCSLGPAQQRDLKIEPIRVNRRLALVMGNAAYRGEPLVNPLNDAAAVTDVLRLGEMSQAIDGFTGRLRSGDLGVFYFAGHGVQVNFENFLIPVDFKAASEADVPYTAYSTARVRDKMEKSGARVRLIILDACRTNPFRATRGGARGLAPMQTDAEGTLIAFATGDNNVADDTPREKNSLFTKHLVAALQTPGLSHDEVFRQVKENVFYASARRQNPFTYDNIVGRLVLRNEPAGPPRSNDSESIELLGVEASGPATPADARLALLTVPNQDYANQNWKGALAGYLTADQRIPNDWLIQYRMGMCHLMMNSPEAAVGLFERSYSLRARPVTACYLGLALSGSGKPGEAYRWLRQALESTVADPAGDPRKWAPGESDVLSPALIPQVYAQLADLTGVLPSGDQSLAGAMRAGLVFVTDPQQLQMARGELARVYGSQGQYEEVYSLLGRTSRLGVRIEATPAGFRVVSLDRGMPAYLAGIQAGDVLTAVNGQPLAGLTLAQFVEGIVTTLPFGTKVSVMLLRAGQAMQAQVVAGVPPNLGELAGAGPPTVEIRRMDLGPNPVAAGATFEVGVEYAVTDPAATSQPLAAELSYTILQGNKVVFEGHALPAPAVSGEVQRVVQSFTGMRGRGKFTVKAILRYAGLTNELAGELTVR
jgi:tetratricopeptide (TPR) repeat protein